MSGLTWKETTHSWLVSARLLSPTDVPWNLCSLLRRPAVGSFAHYDDAAAALRKAQDFLDAEAADSREWTVQRATRAVAAVRRMGEKLTMESERDRHVAAGGGSAAASGDGEPTSSSGTPPPPVTRLRQKQQALLKRKEDESPSPPPTRRTKLPRLCTAAANLGGDHHSAAAAADTYVAQGSIDDLADTLTPGTLKHTCFVLLQRAGVEGIAAGSVLETAAAEGLFTGAHCSVRNVKGAVGCSRPQREMVPMRLLGVCSCCHCRHGHRRLPVPVRYTGTRWYCPATLGEVQHQDVLRRKITRRRHLGHAAGGGGSVQRGGEEAREAPPGAQTCAAMAAAKKARKTAPATAAARGGSGGGGGGAAGGGRGTSVPVPPAALPPRRPRSAIPGLVGIKLESSGKKYSVKISGKYGIGTGKHIGVAPTLREAVDLYNKEAKRHGKTLQVLKPENQRAADAAVVAMAAAKENATISLPLAPCTPAAKKARKTAPATSARGSSEAGGGAAGGGRGTSVPVPPAALPPQQQQPQHEPPQQPPPQQPPQGDDMQRMMDKIAALEQYNQALQSQNEMLLSSADALARQVAQG
jgi:hypothetical protein